MRAAILSPPEESVGSRRRQNRPLIRGLALRCLRAWRFSRSPVGCPFRELLACAPANSLRARRAAISRQPSAPSAAAAAALLGGAALPGKPPPPAETGRPWSLGRPVFGLGRRLCLLRQRAEPPSRAFALRRSMALQFSAPARWVVAALPPPRALLGRASAAYERWQCPGLFLGLPSWRLRLGPSRRVGRRLGPWPQAARGRKPLSRSPKGDAALMDCRTRTGTGCGNRP